MPYQDHNDETLVLLTLAGDAGAYEALVLRYQHVVIAAAASVTHTSFMAEDAAQDAFVTAWMKLDTLHEPARFGAWVCRIARNCAKNMVMRYRGFLPLEIAERGIADNMITPDEAYEVKEEREELQRTIGRLPERVREIIRLHYFEELSIHEIADRLRITQGTVKSQLHDGRKRIRKELCAMNEKWNDTLLQKVMKKVAELKLWRLRSNKDGFEKVYHEVLRDVEELPESNKKQHALADVLMHGWWWLPGDKNDALFARIKQAAEAGHNDEVMEFIVTREDSRVAECERLAFIRETQIPYLTTQGFTRALAREWYWLGYELCRSGEKEAGMRAYAQVKQLLTPADLYYAIAGNSAWMEEQLEAHERMAGNRYLIGCHADELRYVDGQLRYWKTEGNGEGSLVSLNRGLLSPHHEASHCDGRYMDPSLRVGESITGSDGAVLTYLAENETVVTPAGSFSNCQVWRTKYCNSYRGIYHVVTSYAPGIGIVKCEMTSADITDILMLTGYDIKGGEGYLPMHVGNYWRYALTDDPSCLMSDVVCEIIHADQERVVLASRECAERRSYDVTSWKDTMQEIRSEYFREEGNQHALQDIIPVVQRAERLAKTPMERVHTRHAASTARRILETDAVINPQCTSEGCWNFFAKWQLHQNNGRVEIVADYRWSFEWKRWIEGSDPVCCNMILSILEDAGKYLWNDEWQIGADTIVEYTLYGNPMKIQINCTDGGTITTKAGSFDQCMCITFDISGMKSGHRYRGGKKLYWFAPGIGVVRTQNILFDGAQEAIYELSHYEGVGEGYMPVCGGLVRRYEAVGLTDGFRAAAEYTFTEDSFGDVVVFAEKIGVRDLPTSPITLYSAIAGEKRENDLWDQKRRDESRLRHDINNINILLHFLCRYNRAWGVAERAVVTYLQNLAFLETLTRDGELPVAWWGYYAATLLRAGSALCGAGRGDEGFDYLERAFDAFLRWKGVPAGTDLEFGDKHLFGGVVYRKGTEYMVLPDGKKELLNYSGMLDQDFSLMYHAMTTKKGWEWFNPVREDARFQAIVQRVKETMKS